MLRGGGKHVKIRIDRLRCCGGKRGFMISLPQAGIGGCIAIHRGGGRHHHIRLAARMGGIFGKVIQGAAADRHQKIRLTRQRNKTLGHICGGDDFRLKMGTGKLVMFGQKRIERRARRFPCICIADKKRRAAHARLREQRRNLPKQMMPNVNMHNYPQVSYQ